MKFPVEQITIDKSLWFKHWFDSAFYQQLYSNHNEKEAADFIDELMHELQPAQNASALDLCCGNGRHSKYLATKGLNVTGIDLAASSIAQAKRFNHPSLCFYRHDMREPFGNNCHDYVFNFFTSFGYFDDSENEKVVQNISRSLKRGGTLMMDYLNVKYAEMNVVPSEQKEIDGIIYHITRWSDKKYFFKKIRIDIKQGSPMEYTEQVAKFDLADLYFMFLRHKLKIEKVFGDYKLNDYDENSSPRMIMLARKL